MSVIFSKKFFIIGISFSFLLFSPSFLFALTPLEQEAQWKEELAATESEIAKWQSILDTTRKGTASLQQEAAVLNAKIKQAQAFIKQRNIAIAKLEADIKIKNSTIAELEERIERGHESLGQLLRKTNQIDNISLPEIVLGNKNISDFFSDLDKFQNIKKSLADLFVEIRDNENKVEQQKAALSAEQDKQTDQRAAMAEEKDRVQADEKQKEYLIKINKTQEKTYSDVLAERQKHASEIRAKLFKLAGGGAAIPFGDALAYAQKASNKTGVNVAFLLAILTQESNLGANVGKCYLTDTTTGAGINVSTSKTWSNLMKPSRDVLPFLDITKALGFDPLKTVVSCPIAGAGGYGGAMGPAQFIASTWQLLADRIKDNVGHFGNPWDPEDAIMASALYLSDLGASSGSYSSEMRAACKYYGSGGSSCSYGRSVQNLKKGIQTDIDYLNQYGVSRR